MKYICHRANLNGKDLDRENNPSSIIECLNLGFDVEIDVRLIKDKWFLGHDEPQYEVGLNFLKNKNLWIHAKTIETCAALIDYYDINVFFHDKDDMTITSRGWIWVYPGKPICHRNCIAVLPESVQNWNISKASGICTDYVLDYISNKRKILLK